MNRKQMRKYLAMKKSIDGYIKMFYNEPWSDDVYINQDYTIAYDYLLPSPSVRIFRTPIGYNKDWKFYPDGYTNFIFCKKVMNVSERKFLRILKRYGFKFNRDKYNKQIYGK